MAHYGFSMKLSVCGREEVSVFYGMTPHLLDRFMGGLISSATPI